MAEHGKHGVASRDDERHHETSHRGGHTGHANGHHHNGGPATSAGEAAHDQGRITMEGAAETTDRSAQAIAEGAGNGNGGGGEATPPMKVKGKRGGTREQHIMAGRKGGQRVRQLIEEGYLYEKEHGIMSDDNPFLQRPGEGESAATVGREQPAETGPSGENT
jgi:hypothetical protein